MWSQLGGTLPAPLFLFLAGISFALVVDRLRQRDIVPTDIAKKTIRRGAEILGFAFLFRLQEYFIAFPWAPWTDLLRVDILNVIGVSMMLMGVLCWAVLWRSHPATWRAFGVAAGLTAGLAIALLTPLIWTTWRPRWLPWPVESYITGVHNLGTPQAWLFPVFPWTGFAFVGLATGFGLLSNFGRRKTALIFLLLGIGGCGLITTARWLDHQSIQIYPVYDFWHTSPNFFAIRVGLLLLILSASYGWCRWGLGQWGFSPLIQLGTTSLLVYWVHIEFVYGRFSILHKRSMGLRAASLGLATITAAMLLLSVARTRWKARRGQVSVQARPAGAV
jgi:uncharacterized membrane protein